jgi:hypothetical protein
MRPASISWRMKRLIALAVVVLSACSNPEGLTFEDVLFLRNAAPFVPDNAEQLWNEVEACSGLKGDFSAVHWFVAPDGIKLHGKWISAFWRREGNAIVISPPYLHDTITIKHEEMHALLRGGVDHPHQYFVDGPCGNLMELD